MTQNLKKTIKQIPKKPGAYLFKDSNGRIIYIGKALNLKTRVKSHFLKETSGFLSCYLGVVADIDWIKTKNEKDTMILEDQLIKKYQPICNIQWKDDKSYFWVRFTNEEWPRVVISHKSQVTGGKLNAVGPFTSGRELKQTLRVLRKIFPYCACKNPYEKPCLQWHLGLCVAHGQNHELKVIKEKLKKYQKSLNTLSQLLRLYAGEKIRIEAYDISNIQGKYATGSMIVFYGNKPRKSDYRRFRIKTIQGANDVAMIKEVLNRRLAHKEWPYPDLILIDGGIAQLNSALLTLNIYRLSLPIIALAKKEEEIYTEYGKRSLKISQLPESLRLVLAHIRDEAHRFAIFYYHYLHEKNGLGKSSKEIRKNYYKKRKAPKT